MRHPSKICYISAQQPPEQRKRTRENVGETRKKEEGACSHSERKRKRRTGEIIITILRLLPARLVLKVDNYVLRSIVTKLPYKSPVDRKHCWVGRTLFTQISPLKYSFPTRFFLFRRGIGLGCI